MTTKNIVAAVVCMIALGVSGSHTNDPVEASVERVVDQLIQAMLNADGTALADLASEKLSYGHSSGKVESKTEFVETISSGGSVFEEIKISDQRIDVEGNTAVVRHTLWARTNDPGKGPAEIKIGVVLVWTKSTDDWKLLARQAFKLP